MGPGIGRKRQKIGIAFERIGRNSDIGAAFQQKRLNVVWMRLEQDDLDVLVGAAKLLEDLRKRVPALGVRRCDGERPTLFACIARRDLADVVRLEEHTIDGAQDVHARVRQPQQPLAAALEEFHAKFLFKILDVLAEP